MDEIEATETPPPPAAAGPAPAVRTLACPSCGGTITIRAAGNTVTLVCQYCSSVIDVANPDARVIEEYHEAAAELQIPLGTRGALRGIEWEAIGYVRRSDGWASWEEYLLFNPYEGYRWLITDGRGWSFGELLTATPGYAGGAMIVGEESYQPFFSEGTAKVDYVLGEFYWRVTIGEQVRTADYVRPGFMLSWEANSSEETWTRSELIDPKDVRESFGAPVPPGWPGSGRPPMPHQPSPYAGMLKTMWKFALAAIVALILLNVVFGGRGQPVSGEYTLDPDREERTVTLGPIELKRPRQAVTIEAASDDVSNQWVDLDYALVDRKTQASYEAYGVVEYYSGVDSDGSWSEGSRSAATKMAVVPAGTYDLVVDAGAHNWTGGYSASAPVRVKLAVAPGATFWSNFFLALLLIAAPALWLSWRHLRFESARQAESDAGPSGLAKLVTQSDDEDDDE